MFSRGYIERLLQQTLENELKEPIPLLKVEFGTLGGRREPWTDLDTLRYFIFHSIKFKDLIHIFIVKSKAHLPATWVFPSSPTARETHEKVCLWFDLNQSPLA